MTSLIFLKFILTYFTPGIRSKYLKNQTLKCVCGVFLVWFLLFMFSISMLEPNFL